MLEGEGQMKLGAAQEGLLLEALRRYVTFHQGELLTEAWTGLGSYSAYKSVVDSGLMTYVHKPRPGTTQWWKLTPTGAEIVQGWLDEQRAMPPSPLYNFELVPVGR